MSITMNTLSDSAIEESTFIVIVTFTDEDGVATVPKTLTWTLTDVNGTVINDKEDEVVSVPAAVSNIVLSGDDLAISGVRSVSRIFTVEGTYDSSLGEDLPFVESIRFTIKNLRVV